MRIAVVGAGIAGLSAAWLLSPSHEVVVYEAGSYAGGHSNTVDVTLDGITHPVDTGFLVHNDRTYPNLIQLFALLGIATPESEMTFSVSLPGPDVEWAGADLGSLFAQRRNLVRPAFWRMVRDILRFNRESVALLEDVRGKPLTLGELLDRDGYSAEFRDWYLYPMGAAIWSTPLHGMADFPAETFLQFCLNHGLLQVFDRPQWKTVQNGSREYVRAMLVSLADVRLSTPVSRVQRHADGVHVTTAGGTEVFDRVILACHTDQALAMLADAHDPERQVLGAIRYLPNTAWLHTDTTLMPTRRKTWSAWNYYSRGEGAAQAPVAVTYWLNRLQPLPFQRDVFVTLNPPEAPAAADVIQRIEYAHPQLDQSAYRAQQRLPGIQGRDRVYFCGAWAGYGFHEDGLKAGMEVARLLGARIPWERGNG
ncbi:MAG: dependent oxidoreductase [Moraxellaceae bacterium]|jgi:predicted NAD/FAD-binding protein|nr:dependent oxidoreductase [Moraxellaceae bacterium]